MCCIYRPFVFRFPIPLYKIGKKRWSSFIFLSTNSQTKKEYRNMIRYTYFRFLISNIKEKEKLKSNIFCTWRPLFSFCLESSNWEKK